MKRKTICVVLAAILLLSLVLCGCGEKCTVSFDLYYGGAPEMSAVEINSGKKLEAPEAPTREGYTFAGWFADSGLGTPWDFASDKVKDSFTLYAGWNKTPAEDFATNVQDKDFSSMKTPGSQETGYEYRMNFLPAVDGISQPYVGDPMPYYEDGVFYLYYLKEGGDSYNHSIYLATTTDFIHFTEIDEPIIESSRSGGQDGWAGTGNIVKVEDKYYFFYTGHAPSESYEYMEKIMLAVGTDLYHFEKVEDWEMIPPAELGQKRDFRDPQAYYDPETGKIYMTVTAAKDGVARILKYTMDPDLTNIRYEGILLSDPTKAFWNLECSDCFQIGDTWYVTYSGQDDTLWYAMSDSRFGEYTEPVPLEGKLFYAAKQVSDGVNNYMAGWTRRSESPSSTQEVSAWGGNMSVQQLVQNPDKTLALAPVDTVKAAMNQRRELLIPGTAAAVQAGAKYAYTDVFTSYERFMLTGEFRFTGDGSFGLAFDLNKKEESYKLISVEPKDGCIRLSFNQGTAPITQTAVTLEKDKDYSFTYIQEGSVGVFYIDNMAALTVRIYGTTGKPIRLFAENNTVVFSGLREYTME